MNVNKPDDAERLSRQQWKNKMKNKRKSTNKYKQNMPVEEASKVESEERHKPMEEVQAESCSNNKISRTPVRRDEKPSKPQKRKKAEEGPDISCPTKEENRTKDSKAGKGASVSSADGWKQKAVEITDDLQQLPTKRPTPEQIRKQSVKREKLRKMLQSLETDRQESLADTTDEPPVPEENVKQDRSASLRSCMEQRLESARFRYINELLYSTSSGEAKHMFKQDPQAFWVYHRGYTAQVQRWPANPVDAIISYIRQK